MEISRNVGSTSFIDKWSKTQMALDNGIDLVVELPLLYAISSAENFAEGGIKILEALKVVDYLAFGTETDDISALYIITDVLAAIVLLPAGWLTTVPEFVPTGYLLFPSLPDFGAVGREFLQVPG